MKRTARAFGMWLVATVIGGSTALGSARMFLVPKGMNPATQVPGTDVTITRYAGQQITVEIWEQATSGQGVRTFQWALPCNITGTSSSSLSRVGAPGTGT